MLTGGPGQRFVLLEGVVRILSSEFVKLKPACKEGVRCFLLSFTVREWKETLLIVSKAQDSGDICVLLISVSGGMGVSPRLRGSVLSQLPEIRTSQLAREVTLISCSLLDKPDNPAETY